MENQKQKNKLNRAIWLVKIGMIGFGYLILSMFQHTLNPLEFHWIATLLFLGWVLIWLQAKTTIKP